MNKSLKCAAMAYATLAALVYAQAVEDQLPSHPPRARATLSSDRASKSRQTIASHPATRGSWLSGDAVGSHRIPVHTSHPGWDIFPTNLLWDFVDIEGRLAQAKPEAVDQLNEVREELDRESEPYVRREWGVLHHPMAVPAGQPGSVPVTEYIQVLTTVGSIENAERLGRSIAAARLAACVQIVGPIRSLYRRQGKLDEAQEWLLVIKTTLERLAELEQHIKANHTYKTPEITATAILWGSAEYLNWISVETRQGDV